MTPGQSEKVRLLTVAGTGVFAIAGACAGAFLNGDSGVGIVTRTLLFAFAVACAFVCVVVIDGLKG